MGSPLSIGIEIDNGHLGEGFLHHPGQLIFDEIENGTLLHCPEELASNVTASDGMVGTLSDRPGQGSRGCLFFRPFPGAFLDLPVPPDDFSIDALRSRCVCAVHVLHRLSRPEGRAAFLLNSSIGCGFVFGHFGFVQTFVSSVMIS